MGAKVQCGNYFPGYYSMKDLNEDAKGGSWLQFHEDEMLKRGQYYNNGLTLRPTDGCSEYDKETLKQTMLKHEAIFKKQVYELHRLYRIQKDLMDDLKKKELSKYSFPVEMAQLSPFSFQMESEGIQNSWQACGLPVARSSVCTKPSILVADGIQSPSKFPKEGSLQVRSFPSQNGVNDYELLNSKVKKFPRKMFDLQLPADEYIDSEESELIEDEKIPENDVKLTLGTGSVNGLEGGGGKANSPSQNSLFVPRLVDLNESNQGICLKEATSSSLVNFPNSLSSHEEGGGAQLSWKLNTSCLGPPMDFFLKNQKDRDQETCMNILHAEHEGSKRERLPFNLEAGERKSDGDSFTQGFGHGRGTASSEPMQIGLKKTCNLPSFLLSDQRQTEVRFGENPDCVVEISKTIQGPTKSNYEGPLLPPLSVSFQFFSEIDDARIRTPLVSPLRKSSLNQSPLVVQALPCYKGSGGINKPRHTNSSTQNPDISGDEWYLNSNLRSNPSFKTEVLYQDGFIHGIKSESNPPSMQVPIVSLNHLNLNNNYTSGHEHSEDLHPRNFLKGLDCKGVKSAKHMQAPTVTLDHLNLNTSNTSGQKQFEDLHPRSFLKGLDCEDVKSAKNMSLSLELSNSNGFGDQGGLRRDLMLVDGDGRLGHLSELRKEIFNECMNYKHDTQMGSGFSQDYLQIIPSRDAEIQGFQIQFKRERGPSLGFMQNFSQSLPSKTVEVQKNGLSDVTKDGTILVKPRFSKEHSDFISASKSTNSIQDNFKINDIEKNMKTGLHKGDCSGDQKPPDLARQLSLDLNTETAKSLMDQQQVQLEISSKDEADFPSPGKDHSPVANSKNTNLPEKIPSGGPVKYLLCDKSTHEDTVTSIAAETIVAMSLVACEQSNIVTCQPLMTDLRDCLDWFAEVVVSNGGDIESVEGDSNGDFECSDDGLDFFELMTLRLSETKIDEFLCKTRTQDEEEKGSGSVLHSQSSRGRFQRRRQRRDFQKEILPGIASLSRYEVTEDLQTIGGLMRASGCSWPPGLTRRGVGGNDWHFPARGRRRARCGSTTWTGNLVVSPALQDASNGEPDPEGRSLKGIPWGKTTRRRRMQRFPAGSCLDGVDSVRTVAKNHDL